PQWRISVNLSAAQLKSGDILGTVRAALAESGLPGERLELEIAETMLLNSGAETAASLKRLRELGVSISLDDFGTGYASLNYLREFPFDKIKIDRSFIRELPTDSASAAIVHSIIHLGQALGAITTAEGIETEAQLARVLSEGCGEAQGFLFGRPCGLNEMRSRYQSQAAALLSVG
ncbi:EAL domain-containing protein, partial [Paracraurococcus lichenis]